MTADRPQPRDGRIARRSLPMPKEWPHDRPCRQLPDSGAFWASLPVPALLVDADGTVMEINPAAELFLNLSVRSLKGHALLERLHIDAPMEEAMARVRVNQSAVVINDVEITTGERAPVHCRIQIAPMQDHRDVLMVLISPRDIADRLGRSSAVKTAAKSAIGMAEMLAHEIKNPLAGHFGGGATAGDEPVG